MPSHSLPAERGSVLSGIGFALAAYLLFSLHDATIKWLVADFSAWQVLFIRSMTILPLCILFGGRRTVVRAATSPVRGQLLLRAMVLLAAWLCYYSAARYLQLGELVTLYFASPLIVAVLAIPLLRERVTGPRWAGLVIGFTGVVIACRPGNLHLAGPVGLALLAAVLWAYAVILIRQLVRSEPTFVQMLISNLVYLIACGATMPWQWRSPTGSALGLMLLVGVFGVAAQFTTIEAIRRAPASVVAPLEFTGLVWSFWLGFAIWGDVPDMAVLIGAGLILLSGLLVVISEWRNVRRF